ncbi:MAG: protease HtpX [Bacteriovoracaceae bacterium]|nr:protease HtpX [Bacteriovoracaceae bacterium]
MFKRIMLFAVMNILVVVTFSVISNLLGLNHYITAQGIDYQSLLVFCLLWGSVGSFVSLMLSKFMAKMAMGVKIVTTNDPNYAQIVSRVHQLAQAAGLQKMPEVGVYESPEVNAFATGPSKNNSLVAVSTGLLRHMNTNEVDGVLAHEIAHVKNGDMVTMALLQGVINAFVMFFARIAAFALNNFLRGNSDRENSGLGHIGQYFVVIIFEILFGFLGMFILAYFSRYREFRADKGGAQLAGTNNMVAALEKLKQNFSRVDDSVENLRAMKISSRKGLMNFLSTHPSLDDRIAALRKM